ncbi:MAG TPA: type II toxin-antitoxin system PemK/MazF family toxin [Tepidisphaeraceae bacterium]|nr:type II toxin-antitoxin system PemK/MazF family toxin [Tepidisphaeraceae bacterium]
MPRLQQGSVVWAQLPAPFGRRPVVVLTRDSVVGRLNAVTVAPITRTIRKSETEVILEPADGVPTICAITLDNIFTIQRAALGEVVAVLPREKLRLIFAAIRKAFDMP